MRRIARHTWTRCALAGATLSLSWGLAAARSVDATLVERIAPRHPPAALAAGIEGTVSLAVHVDAAGSVDDVAILDESQPSLGFGEAGTAAARAWRYEPARRDGEAVDAVMTYRLEFRIAGSRLAPSAMGAASTPSAGVLGGAVVSSAGAAAAATNGGGNSLAGSLHHDSLVTPTLPPQTGMYDRRTIWSTRSVPVRAPAPRK